MLSRSIVAVLIAVVSNTALADAKPERDESRGELLYSTHCVACHTGQVHWRDKKLVSDWTSLNLQIRRWQSNTGQSWDEADVAAVARYLNTLYYHFPGPG
jgi:mono/diheme cytochrome c family protein